MASYRHIGKMMIRIVTVNFMISAVICRNIGRVSGDDDSGNTLLALCVI